MRLSSSFSVFTIFMVLLSFPIQGQINFAADLELYYPFNGTTGDSSGNGIHGVAYGGAGPSTDRFGNINSAYIFDGINDYIDSETSFDYEFRTVSFWFNSSNNTGVRIILAQDANTLDYGSFHAQTNSNNLAGRAGGSTTSTIQESIGTGDWHHVILLRTDTLVYFYLNGVLKATDFPNSAGSMTNPNEEFVIAVNRQKNQGFYAGKVDEVRIYSRALNQEEIQALYCPTTPVISLEDTTVYSNTLLAFQNNAFQIDTMAWYVNGNYVNSDSSMLYTFDNEGIYQIVAYGSDGFCEKYDTTYVNVLPDSTCLGTDTIVKVSSTSGGFNGILGNGDLFGMGVCSYPDINGDQIDEIIVGAPRNAAGGFERGALFVLHVNNEGMVYDHYKIGSDSGNLGTGIDNEDNFGYSVDRAGDINGDGIEDLVVGAPYDDDGGSNRGAVYILFMDSTGLVASKQKISDTQGGLQETLANSDRFGLEVAGIGDLNNDGVPDIACGLTTDFVNGTDDGSVLILFLNSNGTVDSEVKLNISTDGLTSVLSSGGGFGQAVEFLGDIDGDGVNDYAMGFGQHDGGGTDRGAFAIVSLDSAANVVAAHRIAEFESGFNHALPNFGNFGSALANMGDIDGDGYLEIGVGNWRDNTGGTERGAAWILSIDSSGYVFNTVKIDENTSGLDLSNSDRFGCSIAAIGDFNNDGVVDLVVGARQDDDGGTDRGAVYLISLRDTCCPLVANFSASANAACIGESIAFTNTSTFAGSGATYQWLVNNNEESTTQNFNFTFNTAGSYYIELVVTDGCVRSYGSFITVHPDPIANAGSSQFLCFGDSVQISASGGISYQWNNASTLSNDTIANPLAFPTTSSIYFVTVTDSNGCSDVDDMALIVNTLPTIVVTGDSLICPGLTSTLTASGASTYTWSPASNLSNTTGASVTSSAVVTTTYTVEGTDMNSCAAIATFTVFVDTSMSASIQSSQDASCFGLSDGSAVATASGGNAPYTYAWSSGSTIDTATTLSLGTYVVTVTDNDGCIDSTSVFIDHPDSITISGTVDPVLCNGGNSGSITVTATGGTLPFQYAWSNSATSATSLNLAAGTYTVTVSDDNNCENTLAFTVSEPTLLTANISSSTNILCNGGNNGAATVNASGGTSPYSYLWSNGSTASTASALVAGTHTVTITDFNGCTTTAQTSLSEPSAALSASISTITNVLCNGGTNGSISASVSGGTAPYTYAWSNAGNTVSISSLSAGVYTITITDANGCTSTASASVAQPTALAVTFSVTNNVSCNGGNNGAATSIPSGGTSPYSYAWAAGSTVAAQTNLAAGSHLVTVTDNNSCAVVGSVNISEPAILVSSATLVDNVSCNGGTDGEAFASANGGTSPYTYAWSSGGTLSAATNLAAGSYTVTVTDNNGCTDESQISIAEPTVLVATIDSTFDVLCNGGNNGFALSSASGGTSPYTFAWSSGSTVTAAASLSAGNYTVTITDNNGCAATAQTSISEPTALVANAVANDPTLCFGDSNGIATVSASGGTSPYNYNWESGETTAQASMLWAGSRSVTVTDVNGCTVSTTVAISQPALLEVLIDSTKDVICNGFYDGAAYTSATGGVGSYQFNWNSGQPTDDIDSLTSGLYIISVTDANGCLDTASVIIIELDPIIPNVSNTNVSCFDGNDASATSAMTGGGTVFSYTWSTSATATGINGLSQGTYTLTISDENDCFGVDSAVVTQPDSIQFSKSTTPITCFGLANGTASFVPSGGTAPYTYAWSNGANDTTETNLDEGYYSITITDANNCFNADSLYIAEPSQIGVNTSLIDSVSCFGLADGNGIAAAFGGVGNYSYTWSNAFTTDSLSNVLQGTYTITVMDSNNCEAINTLVIPQPALLQLSLDSLLNAQCYGAEDGALVVGYSGGNGGISYAWSTSATGNTITNLGTGNYGVTITDFKGCQDSAIYFIDEPDTALHLSSVVINDAYCQGGSVGSVTVVSSGGTAPYTYLWSNSQTANSATELIAGSYGLTITDAQGCQFDSNFTVAEPSAPDTAVTVAMDITCFGDGDGSVSAQFINGIAPYTYAWSNSATTQNISNLLAGTYNVTVTDAVGCIQVASDSVAEPSQLTVSVQMVDSILCHGDSAASLVAIGSGGIEPYSFIWSTGATTDSISALPIGNYLAGIADANGCTASDEITVDQPILLIIDSVAILNASCNGFTNGEIQIFAAGGTAPLNYTWSSGDTSATLETAAAGLYTLTITDLFGCNTDTTLAITQPDPLVVSTEVLESATCENLANGGLAVSAIGGTQPYNFLWNTGAILDTIIGLNTGNYSVTVIDQQGCVDSSALLLPYLYEVPVSGLASDTVLCDAYSNSIFANQGFAQYQWSTGSVLYVTNVSAPGVYALTITSAEGCITEDTIQIDFGSPTPFTLGADTIVCMDDNLNSLTIAPSPNSFASYLWSTGATSDTISVSSTGSFSLDAINAAGCLTSDQIIVVFDTCRNVSASELSMSTSFKVFPNPTRSSLNLVWENEPGMQVNFNIRSAEGKLVGSKQSMDQEVTFDLEQLASGIYILEITSAHINRQVRIVRQ